MKLIVQIPCFNEEETLPATVADIPREIEGVEKVEILVIDDGSTDRTVEVAHALGVDHVVCNKHNVGLARTFRFGLDAALQAGADVIVNTDGDNQYMGADIPLLIAPVLSGQADMVIGDRQTDKIEHFSRSKKFLQWFGSGVVRKFAGIWVPDAVSGFRAFSRDAALKLNIVSAYSYTIETVIQAGKKQLAVQSVPIRINPETRKSRLFKNVPDFVMRQVITIIRMYAMYQPLRFFFYMGATLSALGLIPVFRFLYFYLVEGSAGYIQSLVLGGVLLMMGFISLIAGLVADLISFNRQIIEMTLERIRKFELQEQESGDRERRNRGAD